MKFEYDTHITKMIQVSNIDNLKKKIILKHYNIALFSKLKLSSNSVVLPIVKLRRKFKNFKHSASI